MKTLYTAYDLECKDSGEEPATTLREFSEAVLNVFPNVTRTKVRQGDRTFNLYFGVQLKPLGPLRTRQTENADLSIIPGIVVDPYKLVNMDEESVHFECATEFLSNGNEVRKILKFKKDYTFHMFVGDKEVDLSSIGIENNFHLSEEGVSEVCEMVKKVRLCFGVTVTKDTVCSRLHTVENWKNKNSENSSRQLRSLMCCRVVKFNSRSNTCTTCQQMTIKKKNPHQQSKKI